MTSRTWPVVGLVVLLLLAVAGVVWMSQPAPQPSVSSRNVLIDVVDGPDDKQPVELDATFYVPETTPAPAVRRGSQLPGLAARAPPRTRRGARCGRASS